MVCFPEGAILASFDIVSLYTSINHYGGVQAMKKVLNIANYSYKGIEFILSLLWLVPTSKYFKFGEAYYLQLWGTTMGANVKYGQEKKVRIYEIDSSYRFNRNSAQQSTQTPTMHKNSMYGCQ